MPRSRAFSVIALVVFFLGIGSLALTLTPGSIDSLSASLLLRRRGERMQRRGGKLTPIRTGSCAAREECASENKAPPCAASDGTCTEAKEGKTCGKNGTIVSYCYSCPSPAWLDSSHHTCR